MGNFYTNFTFKGASQGEVAKALAGRTAFVTTEQDGCVMAFDEESDDQDEEVISRVAKETSRALKCPVLAVLNHDDDIFWYQLYVNGKLVDQYDSTPGYFDGGLGILIRKAVTRRSCAGRLGRKTWRKLRRS